MTTLTRSIAAGTDDAQELSGTVNLTNTYVNANNAGQIIGLRFTNITIPPGSTINSATLTVNVTSSTYDDPNVSIRGSGEANPATFNNDNNHLSNRAKTSAAVTWSAANIGSGAETTPDLATLVSEMIALAGWASGNAMAFYMTGNSGTALRIYAYENGSDMVQLTIDYTAPAAAANPKLIRVRLTSRVGGLLA